MRRKYNETLVFTCLIVFIISFFALLLIFNPLGAFIISLLTNLFLFIYFNEE